MSETAISVEDIGKKYHIGALQPGYRTLRESITDVAASPFKRAWSLMRGQVYGAALLEEELWALRGVSFEVKVGEVLGVIGANGAGKSTLLRVLTRITEPTEGVARIRGRVGALLEVGTGTHPELTGRENIYLTSAVLGMKRAEVDDKFDQIVEFAGIEEFLDTPVKHYSDGMRVRLGFSVAAHLTPEILLIDEVLAVGDVSFQRKCLGKMENIAGEGRTILFVSHNMHAVANLCDRVIWLEHGRLKASGTAVDIVSRYTSSQMEVGEVTADRLVDPRTPIVLKGMRLVGGDGRERDSFAMSEPFAVELDIVQKRLESAPRIALRIRSAADDSLVLTTTDWNSKNPVKKTVACEYTVRCLIPGDMLNDGSYALSVGVDIPRGPVLLELDNIQRFVVVNVESHGDGIYGHLDSVISPYRDWELVSYRPLEE